ncbi:MAG TPA: hypothetical protein VLQ91_07225 [Draconibacterium sp.]|jgi:hypothetical protein|nr:hypothetical protein [Draconibacterium sp.]
MKTSVSKFLFVVFLSFMVIGIQAQNAKSALDQKELIKQFEGKWQAPSGKDSVEIWNWQPYGNAYECVVTLIVNKKEIPNYKNLSFFDNNSGKFYGAAIFNSGWWSGGWNGSFAEKNKFIIDIYSLPDPVKPVGKGEFVFEAKDRFTFTNKNIVTGTVSVLKFAKVR